MTTFNCYKYNLWFPEGPFQDEHYMLIEKKLGRKFKSYGHALQALEDSGIEESVYPYEDEEDGEA